ncbi:MAG TPA: hypothetical protein VNA13_05015 [Xanthomonadales bacterium]|nr:hypothetical protein [Xanthomonadales bacterium]
MFKGRESSNGEGAIPDHWKLPERDAKGLQVTAVDKDRGFLRFKRPNFWPWTDMTCTEPGEQFIDNKMQEVIFDSEGKIIDSLQLSKGRRLFPSDYIKPNRWGFPRVRIDSGITTIVYNLWEFTGEPHKFGVDFEQKNPITRIADPETSLGGVSYARNKLMQINFGGVFGEDEDYSSAPPVTILADRKGGYKIVSEYHLGIRRVKLQGKESEPVNGDKLNDLFNVAIIEESQDKAHFIEKNTGKILFTYAWEIVDGFMVASQENVATGVIKTINAPEVVDMRGIRKAMRTRTNKRRLKSGKQPWREVGNLVGAELSYSDSRNAV